MSERKVQEFINEFFPVTEDMTDGQRKNNLRMQEDLKARYGYYQPGNTYDDLNPVLIKLGYTNSLGVYVEENFAYLLAPDCSYADLEELSNLANEAIGAQMKYPNDVNNMYRNTYNAYPLSKVWNFYTRSWS